jgi:hypothetical protein
MPWTPYGIASVTSASFLRLPVSLAFGLRIGDADHVTSRRHGGAGLGPGTIRLARSSWPAERVIAVRNGTRFAIGMIAAAYVLLALSGSATANRLSLSNRNIRWMYTEYTSTNNAGVSISCAVTFEGSFHSATLAKVRGALIGHLTRVTSRSGCSGGGDIVFLAETLPWHLRYASFAGTLPNISSISVDVIGFAWRYPGFGGTCLYRSTAEGPARFILNRGPEGGVRTVTADPTVGVPFVSGEFICPETINYRGTGTMSLLGTTNTITVTLI